MARKPATVITTTSLFTMWESSWAITPSSWRGSSRCMIPVVTQTVAVLRLCPAAKALGMSACATAIFGFGMSASWHSRSTMACSSGASLGSVTRALIAASAILSPNNSWARANPPASSSTMIAPTPAAIRTAMKTT